MTDTPRLLTMTSEQFEDSAYEGDVAPLKREVLAQAARVQALEQELGITKTLFAAEQNRSDKLGQERERIRQAVDKISTELGAQTDMLAGFVEIHPELSGAELSAVVQASTVTSILGLDELLTSLPPAGEREETRCAKCRQVKDHPFHAPKGLFGRELETHEFSPQTKDETR